MRRCSLILMLFGCASCMVRVPTPVGLKVSLNATIRTQVRVEVPKPPEPAVALQGAPIVEFFGIPLEGTADVVFVLDCSGSMSENAQGRIAQIEAPPDAAPSGPGPPPPAGPPSPAEPPSPAGPLSPDAAPPPDGAPPPPPPPPRRASKIEVAREELIDALQRLAAGTPMNIIFFNDTVEAFAPGPVPLEEGRRAELLDFVRGMTASGATALAPAMRTALLMNARRIVLLSDGLGNVGGDSRAVLRDAREAMRGGVRIDTIGLGHSQDAELLLALAQESGGIYQAF